MSEQELRILVRLAQLDDTFRRAVLVDPEATLRLYGFSPDRGELEDILEFRKEVFGLTDEQILTRLRAYLLKP